MTKINSSSFEHEITLEKEGSSAEDTENVTKLSLKFFNFKEEFTGNFLQISTNSDLEDSYGILMPPTKKEIRLDDRLVPTAVEKTLESSTKGAAVCIIWCCLSVAFSPLFLLFLV